MININDIFKTEDVCWEKLEELSKYGCTSIYRDWRNNNTMYEDEIYFDKDTHVNRNFLGSEYYFYRYKLPREGDLIYDVESDVDFKVVAGDGDVVFPKENLRVLSFRIPYCDIYVEFYADKVPEKFYLKFKNVMLAEKNFKEDVISDNILYAQGIVEYRIS
jgi:hypothetical protein